MRNCTRFIEGSETDKKPERSAVSLKTKPQKKEKTEIEHKIKFWGLHMI